MPALKLRLAWPPSVWQSLRMSLSDIIETLPSLSHEERRELCRRVLELESESEDIALCDHVAREGFAMLDRMEAEDEVRGQSPAR